MAQGQRIPRAFYTRDTLQVARDLLGARLVRIWQGQRLSGRIVECEAYKGLGDTASHASRGQTPRNAVMFGPPGHAYVYFTYGIHWMLNVVTEPEGVAAAVLIRAIEPVEGTETMWELRRARGRPRRLADLTSGPAKLTQALAIDGSLNGADLVTDPRLWLEFDQTIPSDQIARGPRIGIHYAAEADRNAPWRFWIRDNPFVSHPRGPRATNSSQT